ncbi:MAG: hypothetical protein AAF518_28290 [Spirochaetota bacterium]
MYQKDFFYSLLICLSLLATPALKNQSKWMTMHDFMEDFTKPATKLYKKGEKEKLKIITDFIPHIALKKDRSKWKEIVQKAKQTGNLRRSCKSCHKLYKRKYKRTYKRRLIEIPPHILKLSP